MTPQPRLHPKGSDCQRHFVFAAALRVVGVAALLQGFPEVASAAEGGLEILPSGLAENFDEHGLFALFYMGRFWTLVALFAVLAVVLNRFVFSPLLVVLEERERRISGARERAAELLSQAENLLGRHGEALREARDRAQVERQGVLDQARGRAQSALDSARGSAEQRTRDTRREVDSALDQARGSLRDDAEGVAQAIADRLLGSSA